MTFAGIRCTITSMTHIRAITGTVIATTIDCGRCVPTKSRGFKELIQPTTAG
jgi:hypothetical protein